MKVGIGLPGAIPGTTPQDLLEWARRAEPVCPQTPNCICGAMAIQYLWFFSSSQSNRSARLKMRTSQLLAPVHGEL